MFTILSIKWTGYSLSNFIDPINALKSLTFEEMLEQLSIGIKSGHKANFNIFSGKNFLFDDYLKRRDENDGVYEDQCSPSYYFDLFNTVKSSLGEVNRIVEVGVYTGGCTSILAACAHFLGVQVDIIDINQSFLQFAREKARRYYPEAVEDRVRMFHGTLPEYVRDVLMEDDVKVIIQHDGSHSFEQVIRDLGSLYYIRDKLHSICIQDTNLRGAPKYFNFVDQAVLAIFGRDVNHIPIGSVYANGTDPNQWEGNYCMAGEPEGMHIPLSHNKFHYPHPKITLSQFFESV